MNLQNLNNTDLISRTLKLAATERKITHIILLHINEIESRKLYADLGYDGMFSFLTKHLNYSESSAYRRLQSARLLKQIPEIAEKLESGSVNLTQLTQVQKCLKQEIKNKKTISPLRTREILHKIENQNTFATEQVLAIAFNRPKQSIETIKPQQDHSVRLEITLSKEQYQDLIRAKELLSHVCPEGRWNEVIHTLAKKFNQTKLGKNPQIDPSFKSNLKSLANNPPQHAPDKTDKDLANLKLISKSNLASESKLLSESKSTSAAKSESQITNMPASDFSKTMISSAASYLKSNSNSDSTNISADSPANSFRNASALRTLRLRPAISAHVKKSLLAKAHYCCQYQDLKTGKKCQSKFQLQIDHIQPVSLGGSHEENNLRIMCSTHNRLFARKSGFNFRL